MALNAFHNNLFTTKGTKHRCTLNWCQTTINNVARRTLITIPRHCITIVEYTRLYLYQKSSILSNQSSQLIGILTTLPSRTSRAILFMFPVVFKSLKHRFTSSAIHHTSYHLYRWHQRGKAEGVSIGMLLKKVFTIED